ncbi:MAG: exo-beta-N-acetylmuramidase NamZ domain-containing protein [Leptospirales bacterium]
MVSRLTLPILFVFCTLVPLFGQQSSITLSRKNPEIFYKKLTSKFHGKNLCIITNQSATGKYLLLPGVSPGTSLLEDFLSEKNIQIYKVFTPEHGLTSMEQVQDKSFSKNRVRFYSVFMKTEKEMRKLFKGCSDLLFDLPDVGVRPYTYRTILTRSMVAVSHMTKPPVFVLVDHPNPAAYLGVTGPVARTEYFSYLGEQEIAFFPGYTYAELARYFVKSQNLNLNITFVRLANYNKNKIPDRSIFLPPSPNIPDDRALRCYWLGIFLESTTFDYGRNSNDPFCIFGHPGIKHDKLPPRIRGIHLERFQYKPMTGKYKGKLIRGFKIVSIHLAVYRPDYVAYQLLLYFLKQYPEIDLLLKYPNSYKLDLLTGTDSMRKALLEGLSFYKWKSREARNVARFRRLMEPYRLY